MRELRVTARLIVVFFLIPFLGVSQEYYTRTVGELGQGQRKPAIIGNPGMSIGPDIRLYPSSSDQSEVSIAVNWCNDINMLVGANVVGGAGYSQGYFYTEDRGATWDGSESLPGISYYTSDPAVAFDVYNIGNPNGYSNGYFNYLNYEGIAYELAVRKTTDGGETWLQAVTVPSPGDPDKNHMAVDPTNGPYSNSIYIGYTDFDFFPGSPIRVSRSTDLGATFSIPVNISSDVTSLFSQGVNLQVGAEGEVYAAWAIYDDWNDLDPDEWDEEAIGFAKSLNGGASWDVPERILEIGGIRNRWTHKNPDGEYIRVSSFPSMAVDRSGGPFNGTIYLVWANKGSGSDKSDIHLARSTDGGVSWSTPVRLNNDNSSSDQWFPWVTVSPFGRVSVVFYDSRNDPGNQFTEVWISESTDGGQTFEEIRASDVAFLPLPIPGTATGYMGDYIGVVSTDGVTIPSWADNRTGVYQVYIDLHNTYLDDMENIAGWGRSPVPYATAYGSGEKLVYGDGRWHRLFHVNEYIAYSQSEDDGATWTQASLLNTSATGWLSNPTIHFSGGKLHSIFKDDFSTIFYASGSTEGDWEIPRAIGGANGTITGIASDMDPEGICHVAYSYKKTGPEEVHYVVYGSFDTSEMHPVLSSTTTLAMSAGPVESPSISVDPATGSRHIVWDSGIDILYKYQLLDLWSPIRNVSASQGESDLPVAKIMDNKLHVVWQEEMSGSTEIFYRTKMIGGTWGRPMNISDDDSPSVDPCIAGPIGGEALIVWADSSEDDFDLKYRFPSSGLSGLFPVSESDSRYPACGVRSIGGGSRLVFVCTEGSSGLFEVASGRKDFHPVSAPFISRQSLDATNSDELSLFQNRPNPFNPLTVIKFQLPEAGHVSLTVSDLIGQEVATLLDEHRPSGFQDVEFYGGDLPSGIYFYRLEHEGKIMVRRMILLK